MLLSRRVLRRLAAIATVTLLALGGLPGVAAAGLPGASPQLTRAPYLSDLTAASVRVTWATTIQSRGTVRYGTVGHCADLTVVSTAPGLAISVNGVSEFQDSIELTGLGANQSYCYRIFTDDLHGAVDLLGTNATPQFTTLSSPDDPSAFTFVVFGDAGDTTGPTGVNDGSLNPNQAALNAAIAASGARFALSTGDTAYPGGDQRNYGDLNQTGPDVSAFFAAAYWAVPGQRIPLFLATGNHGRNSTFVTTWPQQTVAAASEGTDAMLFYPSIDGSAPASYPSTYYAFSTGGVRFYVLDAAWSNTNTGTATGGTCGSRCAIYEVDHDAHWVTSSAEYQWLARDLAEHPGGIKLAFFHFPLRSDNATESSDLFLQNRPDNPDNLEKLLHDSGVQLAFNGHAHTYQRFVAPPGGVSSYVTGGGGARLEPVSRCTPGDAYAIGWSYTKPEGSRCGAAAVPTNLAQVFHFLKITVSAPLVTVTPINAQGQPFDQMSYNFGPDPILPTPPAALSVSRPNPTRAALSWPAAQDNVGVSAYDIYRDLVWQATVPVGLRSYSDDTVEATHSYTYEVRARDLAGNTATVVATLPAGKDRR